MWKETILGNFWSAFQNLPGGTEGNHENVEDSRSRRTGTRQPLHHNVVLSDQAHGQGLKGVVELKTEECHEVVLFTATYRKLPASLFTITPLVIYISFSEPVWGNCAFYFVWKCSICWRGSVSIVPSVRKVVDIHIYECIRGEHCK